MFVSIQLQYRPQK